jgi:hypothetical protein
MKLRIIINIIILIMLLVNHVLNKNRFQEIKKINKNIINYNKQINKKHAFNAISSNLSVIIVMEEINVLNVKSNNVF